MPHRVRCRAVRLLVPAVAVLAAALVGACARKPRPEIVPGPPERFDWARQPIEFRPPSPQWERQQQNEGGQLGVFFTHRGSVGERIIVAAYRHIAERIPTDSLRSLLERFDGLDDGGFRAAVAHIYARTEDPISEGEARVASDINGAVSRASAAWFAGRPDEARWELRAALDAADSYALTLEQVIDDIRFDPATAREPQRYGAVSESTLALDGRPAVWQGYGFRGDTDSLECRDVYVVARGVPFIASYMGLERNLPLFDSLLASIRFPEPGRP